MSLVRNLDIKNLSDPGVIYLIQLQETSETDLQSLQSVHWYEPVDLSWFKLIAQKIVERINCDKIIYLPIKIVD